jgi:hypothetical protein
LSKVRDRSRDHENPVAPTRGEHESTGSLHEQRFAGDVGQAEPLDFRSAESCVFPALAFQHSRARSDHALTNNRRAFAAFCPREFVDRNGRNFDLNVDSIQ